MNPMLADRRTPEERDLRFPLFASPKIDGWRCLIRDGVALSRRLKPLRNPFVQSILGVHILHGLDGEVVVGDPTHPNCMQNTAAVNRLDGEPDFKFLVFDNWDTPEVPYRRRYARLVMREFANPRIEIVRQSFIETYEQLLDYETHTVAEGYEGVILRSLESPYKYGRSTLKEGYLLKVKRFTDSEAEVIGVEELMHNDNEPKRNAVGKIERSSSKAGKRPGGTLGALLVRDRETGVEFSIGAGFTAKQRDELWAWNQRFPFEKLGLIVTYKHFAATGVKEAPRHPIFKGFRDRDDLDG